MDVKSDVEFLLSETIDTFGDFWGELENITPNKPIAQCSGDYIFIESNGSNKTRANGNRKIQIIQPRSQRLSKQVRNNCMITISLMLDTMFSQLSS